MFNTTNRWRSLLVLPAGISTALIVSGVLAGLQTARATAAEVQKPAQTVATSVADPLTSADPAETDPITNVNDLNQSGPGPVNGMEQVTSISQLTDVKPTDWAFQALQSLVERYGCIVGYPDKTYRGNRALSRYEFAAGVNACLDRINELLAAATADLVRKEDLVALQKLQEEFAAELARFAVEWMH